MGYESRIYIIEKTNVRDEGRRWGCDIARFDLGKVYSLSDLLRDKPATDCYVYADDRDTRIVEDMYGEPLTEVSIPEAIKAIETAIERGEECRGFPPLLATLKALDEQKDRWRELAVLHYGY